MAKSTQFCISVLSSIIIVVVIVLGNHLRTNTFNIHNQLLDQLGKNKSVFFINAKDANYNSNNSFIREFAKRYAPDPVEGDNLHLLFDGYTKRGLSRIGWSDHKSTHIRNIIPYPAKIIENKFNFSDSFDEIRTGVYSIQTINLDNVYKCVRIQEDKFRQSSYHPYLSIDDKKMISNEKFKYNGYTYFILPKNTPDKVIIKH